jgi:hypothetical protein
MTNNTADIGLSNQGVLFVLDRNRTSTNHNK